MRLRGAIMAALALACCCAPMRGAAEGAAAVKTIGVRLASRSAVVGRIALAFERRVRERCDAVVSVGGPGELIVQLGIRRGGKAESFEIADGPKGSVRIIGADARGLLYGVGRFLRESRCDASGFTPGAWRGKDAPELPFRAIYFATHFHNFYHDAPLPEVTRYVEDLALWGYNTLVVWYDMHHYTGFDDPAAVAMRERLRAILAAARAIGLRTGLGVLANEGYASTPPALRITPPTQIEIRGMYGVEVCPSKPGGPELILRNVRQELEDFRSVGVDYLSIWPYDQGGCGCAQCRPWGCNGFLRMAEPIARMARRIYPRIEVGLSTWLFDARVDEGEWAGLARAFAVRPDWVTYILADSHTTYPRYPLDHGVPGGLPLINFPEISMWGMSPWGGYGANPLPERFQALWNTVRDRVAGGYPYSEGIYEDLNKAIYARFYWKRDTPAMETVQLYAAYEFSPDVADDVARAVAILERNHTRPAADAGSQEALDLLTAAGARLSPQARTSWRWRILYLRALLDREHYAHGGRRTEAAREALRELTALYHAEHAEGAVRPPQ